jgi:hypothetical protein
MEILADSSGRNSAPPCMARIFNCHEKKQATTTEYAAPENCSATLRRAQPFGNYKELVQVK